MNATLAVVPAVLGRPLAVFGHFSKIKNDKLVFLEIRALQMF